MGGRGSVSSSSTRSYYGKLINTDNDTRELNTNANGLYTYSRQLLHDKVVNRMTRSSHKFTKRETRTAHLVVDGNDSYANTTLKTSLSGSRRKYQHQVVSPTEVARNIPDTRKLVNAYRRHQDPFDKAFQKVRREVSTVNNKLIKNLIDNDRAVVVRSKFTDPKTTSALVQRLKRAGYEVHVYQSSTGMTKSNSLSVSVLKKLGSSYTVYDSTNHTTISSNKQRGRTPTVQRKLTPEELAIRNAKARELREKRAKQKAEKDFEKLWNNLFGGK